MLRRNQEGLEAQRMLAEECPVALVYNGTTAAVVMATPADLKDLALGFSLTESIIDDVAELQSFDVIPGRSGIELRMWLTGAGEQRFRRRQRRLVGPTGCGLCGIESLADATRPIPWLIGRVTIRADQIARALQFGRSNTQPRDTRHARSGLLPFRSTIGHDPRGRRPP